MSKFVVIGYNAPFVLVVKVLQENPKIQINIFPVAASLLSQNYLFRNNIKFTYWSLKTPIRNDIQSN